MNFLLFGLKNSIRNRNNGPETDLAMAKRIWGDFVHQREEYKKDLEKQISEKNKRKEVEKVIALSSML